MPEVQLPAVSCRLPVGEKASFAWPNSGPQVFALCLAHRRNAQLEALREDWATRCNRALDRAGHDAHVSHKSLKAQGLDKRPQIHMGVAATAMERRGIETALGDINRAIRERDAHRAAPTPTPLPTPPIGAEVSRQGRDDFSPQPPAEVTATQGVPKQKSEISEGQKRQAPPALDDQAKASSSFPGGQGKTPSQTPHEMTATQDAPIQKPVFSEGDVRRGPGEASSSPPPATASHMPPEAPRKPLEAPEAKKPSPTMGQPEKTPQGELERLWAARKQAEAARKAQEDTFLKSVGVYGQTATEVARAMYRAEEKVKSADIALFHAKNERDAHNEECDKMNFFQRTLNAGTIDKRAKSIEEKLIRCIGDHTKAIDTVAQLKKAHGILVSREKEYEQSPEGRAAAQAKDAERAKERARVEQTIQKQEQERAQRKEESLRRGPRPR